MIDKVKPYMDKLIDILCSQCKLDPDHVKNSKLNKKEND
jgi:hypothetical protein